MSKINVELDKVRAKRLADYLLPIINELLTNQVDNINANMLSKNVYNFSLDKIPTDDEQEMWIIGATRRNDIYNLRSRNEYSISAMDNIKNIGFFENFERIIRSNNKKGILPKIENIESIECLNCGSVNNTQNNTCEMDIQIQIIYREEL